MHGTPTLSHCERKTLAGSLIAEVTAARDDRDVRVRALQSLIELALSGPLAERIEAAAFLESHYGVSVANSAPAVETTSVH